VILMSTSPYDFWLLDLDGTLVDVEESYIEEVVGEVGTRLGASFDAWESEMLWYGPTEPRNRILRAHDVDRRRFWDTFHEVEEPETRAAATHLYPDAERFLTALDEPVGLVTHCQEYLTAPVLDELDIGDWFDTIVCCSEETGWKPDPQPLEMAMTDLGVGYNGHRGAMVGDDPGDTGAAWNAGLSAIHVSRRDPERVGQCVLGDRRVGSLAELEPSA
jgi:phosphoglycolate phosphatase